MREAKLNRIAGFLNSLWTPERSPFSWEKKQVDLHLLESGHKAKDVVSCNGVTACDGAQTGCGLTSPFVAPALPLVAGVSAEAGAFLSSEISAAAPPLSRGAAGGRQPLVWAGFCLDSARVSISLGQLSVSGQRLRSTPVLGTHPCCSLKCKGILLAKC